MTTFKEIRGTTIEVVSSDPSNPEGGQIWYNSSSGTLKGSAYSAAWSSGGTMNTARTQIGSGVGLQTAALAFGGVTATGFTSATELYNGTSWTSNPTGLGTARGNGASSGTQSAAILAGGSGDPGRPSMTGATESWNGSAWTSVPATMNTIRIYMGSTRGGTQTAALAFGGETAPGTVQSATESYNGSSWTSVNSMNTARSSGLGGAGIQTAALAFGGSTTAVLSATESWNGTSWTSVNSLNTARNYLAGAGSQTLALAFGGSPVTAATELWNGTSWTTNPTGLATARVELAGAGTQTAAIAFGGGYPVSSATEEWNQGFATKTITVS
jgi:hypothetical protein